MQKLDEWKIIINIDIRSNGHGHPLLLRSMVYITNRTIKLKMMHLDFYAVSAKIINY